MAGCGIDWACTRETFVGRERELRLLTGLAHVNRSGGAAAVVHGEEGIGKTSLLDRVAEERGTRALRVRGSAEESTLPFAAIADVLLPLRDEFAQLPAVQCEALEISLALRNGPLVAPLAVCAAALGVLAAAAEREPLLVLVDDFHWVDSSSQQVLLFVARRLTLDRVVVLCAVRDQPPIPDPTFGLPSVHLRGLNPAECRALVALRGAEVPDSVLEPLVEQAHGNPRALLESIAAWRQDIRRPPDVAVPHRRSMRHAWTQVIDELPEATRTALYVVTAGQAGPENGIEPVLEALGSSLADLAPAERRGLVEVRSRAPDLRHPLLRSVVAERTPLGVRVLVHRAWAEHSDGPHRAGHLAAATIGPDEAVARELVKGATSARSRGAYGTSAQVLGQAAELTPEPGMRAERLLAVATDALIAGQAANAIARSQEALTFRSDPSFSADVALVTGRALTGMGHPGRAAEEMLRAAEAVESHDRDRATRLFAEAALPAATTNRIGLMLAVARRGDERAAADGEPSLPCVAVSAAAHVLAGHTTVGRTRLAAGFRLAAAADPVWDAEHLVVLARAGMWVEEDDRARAGVGAVLVEARRRGATWIVGHALTVRGELAWWSGHWAAAAADAAEAERWGEEFGQAGGTALAATIQARLDAVRGNLAACAARMSSVTRDVGPYGIGSMAVQRPAVLGLAALGVGELGEAAEELELAWEAAVAGDLASTTAVPFAADLVEAHIRAGNVARAAEVLAWLEASAAESGLVYPTAAAARCRGLLADDLDAARHHFAETARLHGLHPAPYEQARSLLCEGEALRRLRRPAAARPVLRMALTTFDSLGARPWAARAEAELAATGEHRVSRPESRSASLDVLTPQEMQIARVVADGLNNVEAAAALYLSRKTVEAHLTRVYRKLGLRSRTDLARVFGRLQAPPEPDARNSEALSRPGPAPEPRGSADRRSQEVQVVPPPARAL
jgi:DNA-binding CsgD family transcriptional regulator